MKFVCLENYAKKAQVSHEEKSKTSEKDLAVSYAMHGWDGGAENILKWNVSWLVMSPSSSRRRLSSFFFFLAGEKSIDVKCCDEQRMKKNKRICQSWEHTKCIIT